MVQVTAFGPAAKDGSAIDLNGSVIIAGAGAHFFPAMPTCGLHTFVEAGAMGATFYGALVTPAFAAAVAASASVEEFVAHGRAMIAGTKAAAEPAAALQGAVAPRWATVADGAAAGNAAAASLVAVGRGAAELAMGGSGSAAADGAVLNAAPHVGGASAGYAAAARFGAVGRYAPARATAGAKGVCTPPAVRAAPRALQFSPFAALAVQHLAAASIGSNVVAAQAAAVRGVDAYGWSHVGGGGQSVHATFAEADLRQVQGDVPSHRLHGGFRYKDVPSRGEVCVGGLCAVGHHGGTWVCNGQWACNHEWLGSCVCAWLRSWPSVMAIWFTIHVMMSVLCSSRVNVWQQQRW